MECWNLNELAAPQGTRDPIVVHEADGARAVMIRLEPGQELGDHQVHERAWITVVEGSVIASANSGSTECSIGTLLTFDPNERHSIASDGGARILMLLAPWPGEGHYSAEEREVSAGA